MPLGERIKDCRLKANLSQEKLAELVGVSRQAVTKWESGQSAPNTENLFKLAEILGTTVDFLLTADTGPSVAEQVYQMLKNEELKKENQRRQHKLRNLYTALVVSAGYLAVFLLCKIYFTTSDIHSFLGWLSTIILRADCYVFSWLLTSNLFFYASLLSILAALLGKHRLSVTTLTGFALGIPLGELLGTNSAGAFYGFGHYGWAIWGGIFLLSIAMGIWLERFSKEDLTLKSKKMRIGLCVFLAATAAVLLFVRMNMFHPQGQ